MHVLNTDDIKKNLPLLRWLYLGIFALLMCGALSIFVVLLRVPYFGNLFVNSQNIFDLSLVVHVNISIYVWFFSVISIIYCSIMCFESYIMRYANLYSFFLMLAGTIAMGIAAFVPESAVIKTNYIPIVANLLFFFSIGCIGVAILVNSAVTLKYIKTEFNICSVAMLVIISFLALILSYVRLNEVLSLEEYYEHLFYGFGHLVQLVFCQLIMLIYLHLSRAENSIFISYIFAGNILVALLGLCIYFVCDLVADITAAFILHMKMFAGIIPMIMIGYIFINYYKRAITNVGFLLSVSLFVYGGLLGFVSTHGSVSIPAHYHGSIVALTIGIMAFIYDILQYKRSRLANVQMCIYAIGQVLHITSLAIMGGYGALRKSSSMVATSDVILQVSFALGGIIAVVGGAMFVIIIGYSFLNKKNILGRV